MGGIPQRTHKKANVAPKNRPKKREQPPEVPPKEGTIMGGIPQRNAIHPTMMPPKEGTQRIVPLLGLSLIQLGRKLVCAHPPASLCPPLARAGLCSCRNKPQCL